MIFSSSSCRKLLSIQSELWPCRETFERGEPVAYGGGFFQVLMRVIADVASSGVLQPFG